MSEKEPALLMAEWATRALSLSLRAESCFGLREEWQMHEALRAISSGAVICKTAAAEREMQDRLVGYERQIAGQLETLNRQEELRVEDASKIKRMEQWVADLQLGMYVNCVYCGHRYGPGEKTPVSMADALKEHVSQCPEHPMSAMRASLQELLGLWEIAAVMPGAIGKALTLKMDSPELRRARVALK